MEVISVGFRVFVGLSKRRLPCGTAVLLHAMTYTLACFHNSGVFFSFFTSLASAAGNS